MIDTDHITTTGRLTASIAPEVTQPIAAIVTDGVDRLSEAFYTTKIQGMGIGLAICRSIIEAHGGRIWAGANEPRGAVFQFTVPLEPDETVPAGAC